MNNLTECTFDRLPLHWQRIFTLEWESVCMGSKAIAAVIADAEGHILSEGRNQTGERSIPNPAAAHAETEAVRNLDVSRYPDRYSYILYAGLEPCVMCMGTLVMGGIRHVEIAAHDQFGGAMHLMQHSAFIRAKQIEVRWTDPLLGDMQRAFQTVRELLYNTDSEKKQRMLTDFAVCNKTGVEAACKLTDGGFFVDRQPAGYSVSEVYAALLRIMNRKE